MSEIRRRTAPATAAPATAAPATAAPATATNEAAPDPVPDRPRPRITRSDLAAPRVTPTGRFSLEEKWRPYVYRDPARQGSLAVRATAR